MKSGRAVVAAVVLVLCSACSSDKSTGPGGGAGTVTSISVNPTTTSNSVFIGSTLTFVATPFDAQGTAISGQTVTWASSNSLVAQVSSNGVVTGVSAGVASISATIGGVVGQTAVSVTASQSQLSCSSVTPLALNVGDVHAFTGLERSSLCVNGGAGSEYVLVAFNNSLDTSTTANVSSLVSTNTALVQNGPSPQVIAASGSRLAAQRVPQHAPRDRGFEMRMRERERRELNPLIPAARAWYPNRSRSISPAGGISAITSLPGTSPPLGTLFSLNGNAMSGCGTPEPHEARVVAVSTHAIVAVDTLAPLNGFTTADYQSFAATFDTLIFPLDTLNYGAPTDIDGNGHVLLFFSPLVNALTPNSSFVSSYVGGFFYARDLFPLTDSNGLQGCPGSNVGEMFYLPVVDPTRQYNRFFASRDTLASQILTTIVHEFQHLINAGHHLYVNPTAARLEESWLNESMSMLAQELLYFRVSGFLPRQNLDYPTIITGSNQNGTQSAIVNAYLVEGLQLLDTYLLAPESSTPYDNTENVQTLGAGWQFLRYLLDNNTTASQVTSTRALENGLVSGFANVENVFSLSPSALATAYQSWAIAQYVDDTGLSSNPVYSNPSWNFRSVFAGFVPGGAFPLFTRPLLPTTPATATLRGGSASYIRFRVNAGLTAQITPAGGTPASTLVTYTLIRTF